MANAVTVKEITHTLTVAYKSGTKRHTKCREWYGLSLALEGKIVYTQGDARFVSDNRHIVLLPKGASYELRCIESGRFLLVNFLADLNFDLDTFQVIPLQKQERWIALHEKMEALSARDHAGCRAGMLSCLYEMLSILAQESDRSGTPSIVRRALKYIDANLSDPTLSNGKIAEVLDISEVYLRKLFSTYLSTSPKAHILELRMSRAESLLIKTSLPISAVAQSCGFTSSSLFCRAFKTRFASTPTDHRQKYRALLL